MKRILTQPMPPRTGRPGAAPVRAWALGLLILMLALLALSTLLVARLPALHWLRAFAEAASVGALADWFAVSALFRHPLGLPIPHTAVIPRNKAAIGIALGRFVEQNFLAADQIEQELERADAPRRLLHWLADAEHAQTVAAALASTLPAVLESQDPRGIADHLEQALADQLGQGEAARLLRPLLDAVLASGVQQELLDRGLEAFADWIDEHHRELEPHFHLGSRYTPEFLDRYLAAHVLSGIQRLLREIATDADHAIRQRFDALIAGFGEGSAAPGGGADTLRALLARLPALLRAQGVDTLLWASLRQRIDRDLAQPESALRQWLAGALRDTALALLADPVRLAALDAWLSGQVRGLVIAERHRVARMIAEVVARWDAREVARKIEAQVGDDLQFIRINGTLVGGAAGLLLHALMMWLPPI